MKKLFLLLSVMSITLTSCFIKDGVNPETTECQSGFEGENCRTESRAKLIGLWNANDTNQMVAINYHPSIAKNSKVTDILLIDFANYTDVMIKAELIKNVINIPQQTIEQGVQVTGTGLVTKIDSNEYIINWNYTISNQSGNFQYTGIWK